MKSLSLKRNDFLFLKKEGEKIQGKCFIILYSFRIQQKGWAVVASKRIGNAVIRNYNKRVVREIFRKNDIVSSLELQLMIICLKTQVTFSQKEKDLVFLLEKIKKNFSRLYENKIYVNS